MHSLFFFKHPFSLSNVHHPFSKLKKIIKLIIKKEKGIEIGDIHFYNTYECFWFKHVFGIKNHEF